MLSMTSTTRFCLIAGAIAAGLAVASGAFGAHALRQRIPLESMAIYQTAVSYQFWHAMGLFAIAFASTMLPHETLLKWSAILMVVGMLVFCGSLYGLTLSGYRFLGAVTPIGGACFILSWILLAVAVARNSA